MTSLDIVALLLKDLVVHNEHGILGDMSKHIFIQELAATKWLFAAFFKLRLWPTCIAIYSAYIIQKVFTSVAAVTRLRSVLKYTPLTLNNHLDTSVYGVF